MSTDQNRVIDRRDVAEVLNKGNLAAIDEIMAPSYVGHVPGFPPSDREGEKQLIGMFCSAFPDLCFTMEDQIAEDDKKVVEAWGFIDMMGLMQQLGAIPAPRAVRSMA